MKIKRSYIILIIVSVLLITCIYGVYSIYKFQQVPYCKVPMELIESNANIYIGMSEEELIAQRKGLHQEMWFDRELRETVTTSEFEGRVFYEYDFIPVISAIIPVKIRRISLYNSKTIDKDYYVSIRKVFEICKKYYGNNFKVYESSDTYVNVHKINIIWNINGVSILFNFLKAETVDLVRRTKQSAVIEEADYYFLVITCLELYDEHLIRINRSYLKEIGLE